jgi:hypothetical protein
MIMCMHGRSGHSVCRGAYLRFLFPEQKVDTWTLQLCNDPQLQSQDVSRSMLPMSGRKAVVSKWRSVKSNA